MSFNTLGVRLFIIITFWLSLSTMAAGEPVTISSRTALSAAPVQLSLKSAEWLKPRADIKVGVWEPAHPPFVMDADPQVFEGLSADYLEVTGQSLGKKLTLIKYQTRREAIQALTAGDVDMLPWYHPQPGENDEILLSTPYQPDHAVLVHQPTISLNTHDDLDNKTLVFVGDAALKARLANTWPKANIRPAINDFVAMAEVTHNENVVMWSNDITAKEINRRLYDNRLEIVPTTADANQNMAFAASAKNAPLIEAINSALNTLSLQSRNLIAQSWRLDYDAGASTGRLNLDAPQRDWLTNHPTVPVLIVNTHIPLTFKNQSGKTSGMTIALLDKITQRTGLKFNYQYFENLAEMRAHLLKNPDSLIAVADASARQSPDIVYTRPYLISNWVLVTRNNYPDVHSLTDMPGKTIAVFTGSYYLDELKEQYPQVNFEETDFSVETVFSLWTHNLDGAIIPQNAASFFMKTFFAEHFRIAATLTLPPMRLSMATGINNSILLSIINKVLIDVPPQSIDAQLSGWQMNHALVRYNLWSRYRDYFLFGGAMVIAFLMLIFWRNALLKRNVTQLSKMQAELEDARTRAENASESKSTFLAQMSHEIRTPMNALIGLLELENRGRSSPAQRENNIAVAYESSKSLLMLVGDILDLAKIESGTVSLHQVPVSLPHTINTICTLFRYAAAEKNLSLIASLELENSTILFDPVMLKQIVSNLLSNAIKFTSEGQIEVALYQADSADGGRARYMLEVCDSGVGLNDVQQRAIFEPFVQVEEQQAAHNGTGLGLSICRQLADRLGGTLSVESEPGEGTTFMFSFSAEICDEISPLPTPLKDVTNNPPKSILIVDDHAPNRLLLTQQLEFAGHRALAVEDGEQALNAWLSSDTPFDVVITDCNMPKITGFELIRRLRALEAERGSAPIPMFGLTAMAEHEMTVRAEEVSMTECLFKPVEMEQLLTKIALACLNEGEDEDEDATAYRPVVLTLKKLSNADPAAYRDLIETVIGQNNADIEALNRYARQEDYENVKYTAHNILGGARLIDAKALEEISAEIEIAAEKGDVALILPMIKTCGEIVEALEKHLTGEIE